ncbi:hypothetical protein RSO01_41020 [Reyranella soli]|uniref:Uncharacterized protein n=2 Tax=Reyranella soli TaxID=1230389 RepID=A0A512NDA9_9HYPH|nr:hypothetical protein RSO01_41020 [Reyranella soli]
MFRVRPEAPPIDFGLDEAAQVPGFSVGSADGVPGFRVGQADEVPGFRVGQANEVPGFRTNADGSVRRLSPDASSAAYLMRDPNAMQQAIPVSCTSDGSTFGCTTPLGKSFSNLPAPAKFPARIASDVPNYHEYGVLSPPGTSGENLMQGIIDKPTPGPPFLNRPATPEGTVNEATAPSALYDLFLSGTRMPYGAPANPVKSYLWRDHEDKPIVVNVTEPGHGLAPGYVIHYIVETPEGPRIQTEGEGLSRWQAPGSPAWVQERLSGGTWRPYQQSILDRSK